MTNFREALVAAAEHVGSRWAKKSRRKQNGMVSYLEHLAESHPREFVRLLAHALRNQPPEPREDAPPPQSVEELQKILRERGLPDRIYATLDFARK